MKYLAGFRQWRPAPLIAFSTFFTPIMALAAAAMPEIRGWAMAAIAADLLLMTFAGLYPRCSLLGPNWTRLPAAAARRGEIAITIDDGPDPAVTTAVLDILDSRQAKATFFCIGEKAARHPDLCREIIRRGHAVENHSMRHRHNFALLTPGGYFKEIQAAQQALESITGVRPAFFRAPAGLRNPQLQPVLGRLNLQLASWTRRGYDTVQGNPEKVMAKLLKNLQAGDILLLHDANAAPTANGKPVILEVLPAMLGAIAAARLRTVTLAEAAIP